MSNIVVSWRTKALEMLGKRDRFEQKSMINEFSEKMKKEGNSPDNTQRIHVDGEEDFFITELIERNGFYICWEFDEQKNLADVLTVGMAQPKNRMELRLLTHASHLDRFGPKYPWQHCDECIIVEGIF